MSVGPVVAIVGSTGYVGKALMPVFLEALKDGKLKELRVITQIAKTTSEEVLGYMAAGAKVYGVDYSEVTTLATAFYQVDVVVSALGTRGEGTDLVKEKLLDALASCKVKVYFPSEFGTNHYKITEYKHPTFQAKEKHFLEAKRLNLNPIRMLTGGILEFTFGKWCGLDCVSGVWTVVGNAADIPCATTSGRDLARFTLEAVVLAHSDITKVPDAVEVYSDIKTLKEYAKALDNVSQRETKFEVVKLQDVQAEFEATKDFHTLIKLMFSQGVYNYPNANGNQLLNPNESVWKLKTFEEYAQETGGIPEIKF